MSNLPIEAEVTGNVWKIEKNIGDRVEAEDVIMILESMKMEIPAPAPADGKVVEITVAEGVAVEEGQVLAIVET